MSVAMEAPVSAAVAAMKRRWVNPRRLKGWIKGTPALWNAFRRARMTFASLRSCVRSVAM